MTEGTTKFKQILEKLDANRPKVEQIDWSIFDQIMNHCDFTKTEDALAALKLFYENLWMHVVFPLQDDLHSHQRENGRLIVETDGYRRKAERLGKQLQEAGVKET